MDFDQAKQKAIEQVLAEIWPATEKRGEGDLMYIGRVHAVHILIAEQSLPIETGKFVDRDKFKKLIPALKTVCQTFSEISEQGKTALRWHADLMEARSDRPDALVEFEDHANRLLGAAEATMKTANKMRPPDKRTNWQAVAVFDACAAIWEIEEGNLPPILNEGSQNKSRFGAFVFRIFEVLELDSTPRTAQDRLAAWQLQQT